MLVAWRVHIARSPHARSVASIGGAVIVKMRRGRLPQQQGSVGSRPGNRRGSGAHRSDVAPMRRGEGAEAEAALAVASNDGELLRWPLMSPGGSCSIVRRRGR
jgi:hypothetical protein